MDCYLPESYFLKSSRNWLLLHCVNGSGTREDTRPRTVFTRPGFLGGRGPSWDTAVKGVTELLCRKIEVSANGSRRHSNSERPARSPQGLCSLGDFKTPLSY